ncbi:DUF3108 domain-containing protein [Dissulfurispira thermophila]|uniref:DUF3108 domain-containing protein n=1 Tax=Dissulfurispira thermophila TaxID=2715679 RepID=UPI00193CF6D0|nr:DUF3108 domain-containing protein [Dissulfurispira thermophila]
MRFKFLFFAFFLYICTNAFAFDISEKLNYDLTWAGIKVGESMLEVKDNGSEIQITSKASSAKWVSVFYKVNDSVISTLKKQTSEDSKQKADRVFMWIPKNYRIKLKEGKYIRDKEIIFDHATKKAKYINHITNESLVFDINDSTLDPLSCLYYVRRLPLKVGKSIFIEVFDSKKLYNVEVQVLNKEIVETPLGTFRTILIRPIIKSEGIFYRKGDILIWLTDDEKRIPVLLKTKVQLGSVKAVLVSK